MKARVREVINNRWLIFVLRVVLGSIFIAASVSKLPHQAEFINIVTGYDILPDNLARFYGVILPWAELLIGCSLVLGIFSRFASAFSITLIVSFIVASAYSLFHPVEGGCGCFGPLISMSHPVSLAIDALMLLMAVQLLLHKDEVEFLSIGTLLSKLNLSLGIRGRFIFEKASKFAILALAVLVVGMPLVGGAQSSIDLMIDSALESSKPAFLVFYKGCLPCQAGRIFDDLEGEYGDKIAFIHINYGKDPQAAEEFDVKKSPTVLLITGKNDEGEYTIVYQKSGSIDKEELREIFNQVLGNEAH